MPCFEVPPCAGRLPVRLDNRAVRKRALEVGVIRQRIGNALENAPPRKAPKPLEDAVPLPEPRRKIAPRTPRPHPPQNALDKKAVVSRGDPAVALFSADGGAMRARTASAEIVLSSFMVKPALFASCAFDGAC